MSTRRVVAIEGNIGVGKSFLIRKLQTFPETQVFAEKANEGLLDLFYNINPNKYSITLQLVMLLQRKYQMELIEKFPSSVEGKFRWKFWDRSMIGDYIFAFLAKTMGTLTQKEFDVYLSFLSSEEPNSKDNLTEKLCEGITDVVFLWDLPEKCKERAEYRGNTSEKSIPLSYYEGLDDVHFDVLLKLAASKTKIIVTTPKNYFTVGPSEFIDNIISQQSIKLNVHYLDHTEKLVSGVITPDDKFYSIQDFNNKILSGVVRKGNYQITILPSESLPSYLSKSNTYQTPSDLYYKGGLLVFERTTKQIVMELLSLGCEIELIIIKPRDV